MFLSLYRRFCWSLRRLSLKVPKDALILEVGSGGNPYPRSNVLLDAYQDTQERHWEALVHDRPTILSFAENLPFKDKAFDYVIAAHVLEHSAFPEKFLSELERVAKAGYIETPDAFMERINPYKDHRLEVTVRNNKLIIRKKSSWLVDKDLFDLYEERVKPIITKHLIPSYPENFHVRYFWKDRIIFQILNPNVSANWKPTLSNNISIKKNLKNIFRLFVLMLIRKLFSQNKRNDQLDIVSILKCVQCNSVDLERKTSNFIRCQKCSKTYKISNKIFYFN